MSFNSFNVRCHPDEALRLQAVVRRLSSFLLVAPAAASRIRAARALARFLASHSDASLSGSLRHPLHARSRYSASEERGERPRATDKQLTTQRQVRALAP